MRTTVSVVFEGV